MAESGVLAGKVAIVTGSTRGIGRATAEGVRRGGRQGRDLLAQAPGLRTGRRGDAGEGL